MAEKFGHRNEVRELKIGQSFTDPKHTAFHTVKYDFKPASVDTSKKAAVDVAGNNQVTVTVPHLDGAGVPQTVFKGSQRPYQKECVLIIDRVTGEITLEKLSCNIQVKKTRSEFNKLHLPNVDRLSQSNQDKSTNSSSLSRSQTPPTVTVAQRVSNKTKVATSGRQRRPVSTTSQQHPQPSQHNLVPKHSPLHASPSYHPSPMHTKSPKRDMQSINNALMNESHSQSTLASLPMIGIDDYSDVTVAPISNPQSSHNINHYGNTQSSSSSQYTNHNHQHRPHKSTNNDHNSFHNNHHQPPTMSDNENGVGEITDSSSSSSDSDSDSDDNNRAPSTKNAAAPAAPAVNKNGANVSKTMNGYTNGNVNSLSSSSMKIDTHIYDDLCLSESESDSD